MITEDVIVFDRVQAVWSGAAKILTTTTIVQSLLRSANCAT